MRDTKRWNQKRREYVQRFPGRRQLTNKLAWIKARYGAEAAEYFIENPECEECGEERLACLAVHHPEGKSVGKFQTLCMNCHAVEHSGPWTLADCVGMKVMGREIEI